MTNAELLRRAAEHQAKHGHDEVLALCTDILERCIRIEERMDTVHQQWLANRDQAEIERRQKSQDGTLE